MTFTQPSLVLRKLSTMGAFVNAATNAHIDLSLQIHSLLLKANPMFVGNPQHANAMARMFLVGKFDTRPFVLFP